MILRTPNQIFEPVACLFIAPDEGRLAEIGMYRVPLLIMMASWHRHVGSDVEHPELYECFKSVYELCSDTSSPYLKIRNGGVICVKEPVVVVRGPEWNVLGKDKAKTVFADWSKSGASYSQKVIDKEARINHKRMRPRLGNGFAVCHVRSGDNGVRMSGPIPFENERSSLNYIYGMARGKKGIIYRKLRKYHNECSLVRVI